MARADLLVRLVQTGMRGDRTSFRRTVEAIIADERDKRHQVLAQRLLEALEAAPMERPAPPGMPQLDQRVSQFFHEMTPRRKLDSLILPTAVSQICASLVLEHHRLELLRSYNLEPRNRILLIGPPGNGKTSLAEALAEAMMVPLVLVRYDAVVGTYLGETAQRLRKLFEYAATMRCVLFFDEFETLGKERGDQHETGEIKRVVSSLLLHIDSLPSHVMVIGATNHPELLDRAVWRRFQVRMTLPAPSRSDLSEWFEAFQHRIKTPLGHSPEALAKRFIGTNFAEVEEFGASVMRQFVLEQPHAQMKDIISRTLLQWPSRSANLETDSLEAKGA